MALINNYDSVRRPSFFVFLVIAAIVYFLCTLFYRLFFSPLSKIPGPWLTRISGIPEANALKENRRAQWVTELFNQYPGSVAVRTGPSSVSFNHPDAVKEIYGIELLAFRHTWQTVALSCTLISI